MVEINPTPPYVDKIDEKDLTPGPGVYSEVCGFVLDSTDAQGAIVVILGGRLGTGFDIAIRADCVDNVIWNGLAREMERLASVLRNRAHSLLTEEAKRVGN